MLQLLHGHDAIVHAVLLGVAVHESMPWAVRHVHEPVHMGAIMALTLRERGRERDNKKQFLTILLFTLSWGSKPTHCTGTETALECKLSTAAELSWRYSDNW